MSRVQALLWTLTAQPRATEQQSQEQHFSAGQSPSPSPFVVFCLNHSWLSLRFKTGSSGSTQPNTKIEYFFTVLFVSTALRENKAQRRNLSSPVSQNGGEWNAENIHLQPEDIYSELLSLTGLLTATVASRIHRAAQPALLYLVPFTLLPLLTMAYLKVRGEDTWAAGSSGQLAAGSVSLQLSGVMCVPGSPGPGQSSHCCQVNLHFMGLSNWEMSSWNRRSLMHIK